MCAARFDVSGVPPQSGQVARQCPVVPQWDLLRPAEPRARSAAVERRADQARQFAAEVVADLLRAHPDAVVVDADHLTGPGGGATDAQPRATAARRHEATTLAAMAAGARLILGGRLPVDEVGRRQGAPVVLVAPETGGYHPVLVRHHTTLDRPPRAPELPPSVTSSLVAPWREAATPDAGAATRPHRADLLALAHQRRLLEACGGAADGSAGVVGRERVVTWHDLDAEVLRTPSVSEGRRDRSPMTVYDHEFDFRLDVIATAGRHRDDPSVPLLAVPVRIAECADCRWWDHCRPLLEQAHDISLLPRFGWPSWKAHTTRGVRTFEDLAALDWRTAALHDAGVDLPALFAATDALAAGSSDVLLADLPDPPSPPELDALAAVGLTTVDQVAGLDRRLAAYHDATRLWLADSIDQARARVHRAPALLRRGVERIVVPRADVEVDLDLESVEQGVYLWGALVTDRTGTGLVADGYHAFVTWQPLDAASEARAFDELMAWYGELLGVAARAGVTVVTYCYNEQVEATQLRRLAASPTADPRWAAAVEAIVSPQAWVDLLRVVQASLVTGGSLGLKQVAPLAGFAWEDDDPGGEQSMAWHDLAVDADDPAVRQANRTRVLTYNRNDVEATLALRRWLDGAANDLPHLESTDPPPG